MALFERPAHSHVPALLRQGFAARLRSETANIYLSQHANTVTLTSDRRTASVFFFCGGNGPLTAILARPPEKGEPKFLALNGNVILTDIPTLLKLTLSNTSRQLFSISRVAPRSYLSLHHVSVNSSVNSRPNLTKWELFHLEIIPGTIGKGFVEGPFPNSGYMQLSQSISHAILELGVRFRLRSIHNRVLRKTESAVYQHGPQTPIASTRDDEFLIIAFRSCDAASDAICANYSLKDVVSGKFLTLCSSGAKLVNNEKRLCLRASPNGWGTISVGLKDQDDLQWLMAGPRGRLELRRSPGAWETFTIEFIRQSYDAALRELPVPGIYKVAESTTRESLRQQVEARVAEARQNLDESNDRSRGKTFDHSKALAGLSDPPPDMTKKGTGDERKRTTVKSKEIRVSGDPSSSTRGEPKQQKVPAAVSGLPRNKANRKKSKKSRKKQKHKSATGGPTTRIQSAGNQADTHETTRASANSKSPSREGESKGEAVLESDVLSLAAEKEDNMRGPPCAACGRPMIGTYTTALGKSFHAECFCCGKCRRPMHAGAGQFRERGGIPYCSSCYANHLASRCARCAQPILDTVITAMEKTWHKDCLTCTICRLPLTQTFWLYADKPNEPRCSRCVTGDENYTSNRNSRRMLNLPMFGGVSTTPSFPLAGPTESSGVVGASGKGGRARLVAPVLQPRKR